MLKKIIVRFENEEALQKFNKRNKLCLDKNIKSYNFSNSYVKTKKKVQRANIYKDINDCKLEWFNMPEYISYNSDGYAKIEFYFYNDGNFIENAKQLFDQNITEKTKSIWFPRLEWGKYSNYIILGGESKTKYPIYVVSKGRYDNCYTSQYLSLMNVPHYIVVEEFEYEKYKEFNNNEYVTILILDEKYKDNYDTFWKVEDGKTGPGAARNFVWDDSIKKGFSHHWVMDDNAGETGGFFYRNNNIRYKCRTGAIFRACEDFTDRYENLAISGLNYKMFCPDNLYYSPFVKNTRIYSFLLIKNDIPYRWKGRYNEDTDLSLRVLKDGLCTVQFNAFLAGKLRTQNMKGGNTDEFYAEEGTFNKSKMLVEMHPDVTVMKYKFNRIHHEVNYRPFKKNMLILKEGYKRDYSINNYNMKIVKVEKEDLKKDKKFLEEKYL